MVIQLLVINFVVTPGEHNTNEISESITNDFPIPGRSLGVTRHDVGGDSQLLRPVVGKEEFLCQTLLIQEECQIAVFAVCSYARQYLASLRETNRYKSDAKNQMMLSDKRP